MLVLLACTATPGAKDDGTPPESRPDPGAESGHDSNGPDDTGLHTLVVEGGHGGGRYAAGQRVHVWSGVDPQAGVVTGWAPAEGLAAPLEWNSSYVMPAADTALVPTAVDVALPLEEVRLDLPSGARDALQVLPEAPPAVVFFFHGARYDHTELTDNAAASVARRFVAAGYGLVAMDSAAASAAGTGGWDDDPASSADLVAVREAVALLVGQGLPAATPIVAWGMSSGGQFAHAVGLGLPARAVVAHCAPGRASTLAKTTAPTAWFLAERDSTFPTGAEDAATAAKDLTARGVAATVQVHPPTPLYDARFTRIAGIDDARSAALVAELRARGDVDAAGDWLVTGAQATAQLDLAALEGLTEAQRTAVGAEIEIMAADHELYDDLGAAALAFVLGVVE